MCIITCCLGLAGILQHTHTHSFWGVLYSCVGGMRSLCAHDVCVRLCTHKRPGIWGVPNSPPLFTILFPSLLHITPHSLPLQPSSSGPPPPPTLLHCSCVQLFLFTFEENVWNIHSPQKSLICLFLCVSSSHTPLSFITSLADVDLLSVRDSRRIFFPWGILVWLFTPVMMCVSLTPAGGTGPLQSHTGFEWKPVWLQNIFSSGCWVKRPCSVSSMQVFILSTLRLEFLLDG